MLPPAKLQILRRELLSRLDVLKTQAKQARQYLEANGLDELENKSDIVAVWDRIQELIPDDLTVSRANDLGRHLHFAQPHDFLDIERIDIPAVEDSILRYGRFGEAFIAEEIDKLQSDLSAFQLLHPLIRDVAQRQFDEGNHRESVRSAIEFLLDEIRRLSGRHDDGNQLIRNAVGIDVGSVGFSDCTTDTERGVTNGLKEVLQGIYKGVRNPVHHGWDGYSRIECFQILTTCSFVCARLQIVQDIEAS